ncbi:MAG TPA: hypothetical protein VF516_37655, partial [Kofleriaceae bacterium]
MRVWIWLTALVACRSPHVTPAAPPGAVGEAPGPPVASNILRTDYAGSRACADCHGEIYARWEASAMRGMTRDARTAQIRAPFDGATLRVAGDTVTMAMQGGERIMHVVTARGIDRGNEQTFRVTKVVGGRYREDFVGLDPQGEE